MAQGRRSPIYALALGLAVFIWSPPVVQAAEPAGTTLWQARWQYVRLAPRDGGAANAHPAALGRAEIRSGLAQIGLTLGEGDPVEFLTPEERGFLADQLAKALAKAGPDQDVVTASVGMRKTFIGLAEQKLTTLRAFVDQDGLNIIVGEVQADVPNDTSTYGKADPRLVSFTDGRRSARTAATAWTLRPGGAGITIRRPDWAVIPRAAMAVPEPGSEEAQKQAQAQLGDLQRQVEQMRRQISQPPAAATAATAAPPATQVEERLRLLDQLRAKGLVSAREYETKRKQIIDSF